MKRIICLWLCCALLFALPALAEDTRPPLRVSGGFYEDPYLEAQGIPIESPWYHWADCITVMTGDNAADLACVSTVTDDFSALKNSKLLADLSGEESIRAFTERLRPDIKALVTTEDGRIVGLPRYVFPLPLYWRQDAWDTAGLTAEDVPQSYTELLDFLDRWIDRVTAAPETSVCVMNVSGWSTLVGKAGYVHWLLDILLSTWEMQAYAAGETLNFDTPEFIALLTRTKDVRLRLAKAEPSLKKRAKMQVLFENYDGGHLFNDGRNYGLPHTVPFRITREQPALQRADSEIQVVRAGSVWEQEGIACFAAELSRLTQDDPHLLMDIAPKTWTMADGEWTETLTQGYLDDLASADGTFCFAPRYTIFTYEGAMLKFLQGRLSVEQFAKIISVPKRDPNA